MRTDHGKRGPMAIPLANLPKVERERLEMLSMDRLTLFFLMESGTPLLRDGLALLKRLRDTTRTMPAASGNRAPPPRGRAGPSSKPSFGRVITVDEGKGHSRTDPCPCGSGKKYKRCCWR